MMRLIACLALLVLAACCPGHDLVVEEVVELRTTAAEMSRELDRAQRALDAYREMMARNALPTREAQ